MKTWKVLTMAAAIMLLLTPFAGSVEWKTTNQATVQWDAATTLENGDPLPAGNTVAYRVYLVNAVTDPDKSNPTDLTPDPISQLTMTITLNVEGKYFVGVQAVRFDENAVELGVSTINWSDVNGANTPNPFGLVHYLSPATPTNLR